MATNERTAAYLLDQLSAVDGVSIRKMFGEYGIWCDGKTVALICDDQLFVKPTPAGRTIASQAVEAPPYPGAKPSLRIDAECWEDADWLSRLIQVTADGLPAPKPKKTR